MRSPETLGCSVERAGGGRGFGFPGERHGDPPAIAELGPALDRVGPRRRIRSPGWSRESCRGGLGQVGGRVALHTARQPLGEDLCRGDPVVDAVDDGVEINGSRRARRSSASSTSAADVSRANRAAHNAAMVLVSRHPRSAARNASSQFPSARWTSAAAALRRITCHPSIGSSLATVGTLGAAACVATAGCEERLDPRQLQASDGQGLGERVAGEYAADLAPPPGPDEHVGGERVEVAPEAPVESGPVTVGHGVLSGGQRRQPLSCIPERDAQVEARQRTVLGVRGFVDRGLTELDGAGRVTLVAAGETERASGHAPCGRAVGRCGRQLEDLADQRSTSSSRLAMASAWASPA